MRLICRNISPVCLTFRNDGSCKYDNDTTFFCSNTFPFPSPDEYNFNGKQVRLAGNRMITNSAGKNVLLM